MYIVKVIIITILLINWDFAKSQQNDHVKFSGEKKQFEWKNNSYFDLNTNLFVIGEEHFQYGNSYIQSSLLNYLSSNNGVRYLLIEGGHAKAFILDQYFRNLIDENHLVFSFMTRKINRIVYSELKKQYAIKPFKIIGTDYERDWSYTPYVISQLINSDSLYWQIPILADFVGYDLLKSVKHCPELDSIILFNNENKEYLKKKLGDKYFDLNMILRSYNAAEIPRVRYYGRKSKLKKNILWANQRENFIYSSTLECFEEFPDFKAICIYGSYHSSKEKYSPPDGIRNFDSFTSKLNNIDTIQYQIHLCSIKMITGNLESKNAMFMYKNTVANLDKLNAITNIGGATLSKTKKDNPYLDYIIVNKLKK